MLFIFIKTYFWLRNNWSLISENKACSLEYPRSLQMDNYQYKLVGVFISRGLREEMEGPVNSGPPPLAPEGDQQFSAGCLASVLTH